MLEGEGEGGSVCANLFLAFLCAGINFEPKWKICYMHSVTSEVSRVSDPGSDTLTLVFEFLLIAGITL